LADARLHQGWITEPVRKKEALGQDGSCDGWAHGQRGRAMLQVRCYGTPMSASRQ
jgi:hypothetical protein